MDKIVQYICTYFISFHVIVYQTCTATKHCRSNDISQAFLLSSPISAYKVFFFISRNIQKSGEMSDVLYAFAHRRWVLEALFSRASVYTSHFRSCDNLGTIWWVNLNFGLFMHIGGTMIWLDYGVSRSKSIEVLCMKMALSNQLSYQAYMRANGLIKFWVMRSKVIEFIVYMKTSACF